MNIGCKSVRNGRLFGLQSLEGHEVMENYGIHSMDSILWTPLIQKATLWLSVSLLEDIRECFGWRIASSSTQWQSMYSSALPNELRRTCWKCVGCRGCDVALISSGPLPLNCCATVTMNDGFIGILCIRASRRTGREFCWHDAQWKEPGRWK